MLHRNYIFHGILNTIKNNLQINIYSKNILTELRYACRKFISNNIYVYYKRMLTPFVCTRSFLN